jgi:hypothetical protein
MAETDTLPIDTTAEDEKLKQMQALQPIGQAMAVPGPQAAPEPSPQPKAMPVPQNAPAQAPASPAMPVGPPAGASPAMPAPSAPAITLPTPQKSLTTKLWDKTANINNPFERILARTGVGIGKALDIAGSALFPGIAANIPGSQINTQMANSRANKLAMEVPEANARIGLEKAQTTNQEAEAKARLNPGDKAIGEAVADGKGGLMQQVEHADHTFGYVPISQVAGNQPAMPGVAPPSAPGGSGAPAMQVAPAGAKPGTQLPEAKTPLTDAQIQDANAQNTAQYQQAFKGQPLPPAFQIKPGTTDAQAKETTAALGRLVSTNDANEQRKIMNDQRAATERNTAELRAENRSRQADEATNKEIDKAQAQLKDVLSKSDARIENLNEAMADIDKPNGEKDAMGVVKALVSTAGGQGSGVRVTQAELQRISQARGWTDSAKVTLNNIFNPSSYESMSPAQREQLKGIEQDVYNLVEEKNDAAHQAFGEITGARSIPEVRAAQNKFNDVIRGENKAGGGKAAPAEDPFAQFGGKAH